MRINKDGTGRTHVGAATFRELADIRVHKYGYGLPGKDSEFFNEIFSEFVLALAIIC